MLGPVTDAPAVAVAASAAAGRVTPPTRASQLRRPLSDDVSDPWTTLTGWRLATRSYQAGDE